MNSEAETREREFELPPELEECQRKAVRLEWITLAYLVSAVVLLFLTLGQSQAMKAAWIEDMLSLTPPVAFLVASRLRNRAPSAKFPWGMHRAVTVAYVFAALALLVMGGYLFVDSTIKLVRAEHPPIGLIQLFGQEVWLGWAMIAALVYSAVPALFLGRAKLRLADDLHDKVLYADAKMNKADWMTASAAIVGVVGIGFGLWWADAVAALFISANIVHDGWNNVRAAVHDLMDARPRRHDAREYHPIVERMNEELNRCDWVERGSVRLREEGHVFTGEVMVVPRESALADGAGLMRRLEELAERLLSLEWKVYDIVVVPVREIDIPSPGVTVGGRESPARGRAWSPRGQESSPGGQESSPGGQESSSGGQESPPRGRESSPGGHDPSLSGSQ